MRLRLNLLTLLSIFSFTLLAQTAPDFKITTTDNEEINLYSDFLEQGKTVVIELFFVDCPPCQQFAPFMSSFHKSMVEREIAVEFVSLSVVTRDNDETVNEFKKEYDHDWHFAHSGGGSLDAAKPYQDGTFGQYFGTPSIIVIAPDGSVNYIKRVFGNNDAYIESIETAVIESQTSLNENNGEGEGEGEGEPIIPPAAMANFTGGINTTGGMGLSGVSIKVTGAKDTTIVSDSNGNFETGNLLADESYTVSLEKNDDVTNGVTTLDIIFISKHILGIDTFTTNHQYLAADVNDSKAVTTFDIVQIRRVILGVSDGFPSGKSWLFDPAEVTLASLNELEIFVSTAIKLGDLNNSANPSGLLKNEERNNKEAFTMLAADRIIQAGETVLVDFKAPQIKNIEGFQFTLEFDPTALRLNEVLPTGLQNLSAANFNLANKSKGLITASWNTMTNPNTTDLFKLSFVAQKTSLLSELVTLSSKQTKAEAYDFNGELLNVNLAFEAIKPTKKTVHLYPNPLQSDLVNLTLSLAQPAEVAIHLYDSQGRMIKTLHQTTTAGEQNLRFNTGNLPAGVYLAQVKVDNITIKSVRLIK